MNKKIFFLLLAGAGVSLLQAADSLGSAREALEQDERNSLLRVYQCAQARNEAWQMKQEDQAAARAFGKGVRNGAMTTAVGLGVAYLTPQEIKKWVALGAVGAGLAVGYFSSKNSK